APETDPATLKVSVVPTVTGTPSETFGSVGVCDVNRDTLTSGLSLLREDERPGQDPQRVTQVGRLRGGGRAPPPAERGPGRVPDLHADDTGPADGGHVREDDVGEVAGTPADAAENAADCGVYADPPPLATSVPGVLSDPFADMSRTISGSVGATVV